MNNKNNIEEKNKRLTLIMSIISFIVIIGVGYAFFSGTLSNTNNEGFNASSATISIEFDDNDSGISSTLNLNDSVTKRFTLKNTGTKDAYAKINWNNLLNTYTSDSLTYTLKQSTNENGPYIDIDSGSVPVSTAKATVELKNGILVPVNETYYYELVITLNNLDVNQNSDINATFSSQFTVEMGEDVSKSGVGTIRSLVKSANTNSTSVINAETVSQSCTITLAYDGTNDNNLRYVGANPCNYVSFNDEIWRIIGVMTDVDDGTGNLEDRIKLIRNEPLGNYSWDSSDSNTNNGWGINNWTDSDLNLELNTDYLDTSKSGQTTWYNGWTNQKTGTYNYSSGIKPAALNLIGDAKWHLGGHESYRVPASVMYEKERSDTTSYEGNPVTTVSKVALMYSSDYGYAVGGTLRDTCLAGTLYDYGSCSSEDWIIGSGNHWMLTNYSYNPAMAFYAGNSGVSSFICADAYAVKPVVYLKSNVSIASGNGTFEDPFTLEIS